MSLKELTNELHKKAEQMPFNQRLMRGELTDTHYLHYLQVQLAIFKKLETNFQLPTENMDRTSRIVEDISELSEGSPDAAILYTLPHYMAHLSKLTQTEANAHIYLHYLALAYGGQYIKKNVPGNGRMYEFDNAKDVIQSIRDMETLDWETEVNRGYRFMIMVFDELDKLCKPNS
jgi:hypothetical protein